MPALNAPGSPARKNRARLGAVLAPLLLLAACQNNAPGVAAEVGNDSITDAQVDDLAAVVCEANAAQGGEGFTGRFAKSQALTLWIGLTSAQQRVDATSVPASAVDELLAGTSELAAQLTPAARETFTEFLTDSARVQLATTELGRESLSSGGQEAEEISEENAQAEGQRLVDEYVNGLEVNVDPRYGSFDGLNVSPGNGSLSEAASDLAQQAATPEGLPAGDLPASQRCS